MLYGIATERLPIMQSLILDLRQIFSRSFSLLRFGTHALKETVSQPHLGQIPLLKQAELKGSWLRTVAYFKRPL